MGTDSDDMISLPIPPPPRPAARRDAIDAALRKFDGIEEAPAERPARKRPSRLQWATAHRRPVGALVTAALIAVVLIPAVPLILRDSAPDVVPQAEAPDQVQPVRNGSICAGADCAEKDKPAFETGEADQAVAAEAAPSPARPRLQAVGADDRRDLAAAAADREVAMETSPPVVAAPAPAAVMAAPAPPPPAPPPPHAEQKASGAENIAVTGSRMRASNAARQNVADEVGYAAKSAGHLSKTDGNGEFLSRLQAGVKANDRSAIIGLIGFPLRVNLDGRARTYRSREDVERDFDRIFTTQVRSAVLNQRPDNLMSRDGGRLMGNDRLWFGPSCSGKSCSSDGAFRIREVNP